MILPDANLLVTFTWENHQHNAVAENFFQKYPKVATCPVTELASVRFGRFSRSFSPRRTSPRGPSAAQRALNQLLFGRGKRQR